MTPETALRKLEIFIGCQSLHNGEHGLQDCFAVMTCRRHGQDAFEELSRTETICNCDSPQFCTSFELEYEDTAASDTVIRVDVYARKTIDSERLKDHENLGKATMSIHDIAAGNHITTKLSHPTAERKVGILTLSAERIDTANPENNSDVQLDVTATILRKRDLKKTILAQRYELQRAHVNDDCEGHTVWLPIYKSDRISKQRDSNSQIEFSSASLRYRHLCNGDDERRIRIKMYSLPQTSKKSSSESCLGVSEFTLRDLCELDPTKEVLQLEKIARNDVEEVGSVSIVRAVPTDFGSHFALHVNYDSSEKYSPASGEDKRKKIILKKLSLPKSLSLNGRDKPSTSKSISVAASVDSLFANNFPSQSEQ